MTSAADWVAAIGTAGALLAAVYTLWRQIQADTRSEAQKLYIKYWQNAVGQKFWSIVNSSEFSIELWEARVICHHDKDVIGRKVHPGEGDRWAYTRTPSWKTILIRAGYSLIKGREPPKVPYPDGKTKARWTTFKHDGGSQFLEPNKRVVYQFPVCDPDVGVVLKVAFRDPGGHSWWRIWPWGALRSAWDPDFWSIRRRLYITRIIVIMPLIILALAVVATVASAPAWAIIISWIVFVILLPIAVRVFRYSLKFPVGYEVPR